MLVFEQPQSQTDVVQVHGVNLSQKMCRYVKQKKLPQSLADLDDLGDLFALSVHSCFSREGAQS